MAVRLETFSILTLEWAASLHVDRLLGLAIPDGAEIEAHAEVDLAGCHLAWDTAGLLQNV